MQLEELTARALESLESVETDDDLVEMLAGMGIELGEGIETALRKGDPMVAVTMTGVVMGYEAARRRVAGLEVTMSAAPGPVYAGAGDGVVSLTADKREIAPGDDQWVLSGLEKAL